MKHLFNGATVHQSPKGGGGINTAIPLSAQNHQKHQQQKQLQMNWQNNGQLVQYRDYWDRDICHKGLSVYLRQFFDIS
jgi:hypothetical protein